MHFSACSKAVIYTALLVINFKLNGHHVACIDANVSAVSYTAANITDTATNFTDTATNFTDTPAPNENTTVSPSDGMTTEGKDKRILDLLTGVIVNLTVSDGQWHTFTIQFDESLLNSWLTCLGSDYTTNCTIQTQHVFGSAYVHKAGSTSNVTSGTPSENVFTCFLKDSRYVQETAVIGCARSNSTCVNSNDTCRFSTDEAEAVLKWDVSQSAVFGYNESFVRRACGDACETATETTSATNEPEARETLPYWIWIIVGVVGGLLLISLIIVIVILCQRRRLKKKRGSKTLDHKDDQAGDKRSSRFSREEDPSDELRLGDNDVVTSVGFVELSEVGKVSEKNIAKDLDQPERMRGNVREVDEADKVQETELEGD
ncbi:hypothetical protein Btru_055637 [Bulinus truncatus]|nr:hypothetical protein Btru_055637 [Bulinus truncatus]